MQTSNNKSYLTLENAALRLAQTNFDADRFREECKKFWIGQFSGIIFGDAGEMKEITRDVTWDGFEDSLLEAKKDIIERNANEHLKSICKAAIDKNLHIRNPNTGHFFYPDNIQQIRAFHDVVTLQDINEWLKLEGLDGLPTIKEQPPIQPENNGETFEEQTAPIAAEAKHGWRDDRSLLKSDKQDRAILAVIAMKGFDPMAVPDGDKGIIEMLCKAEYAELFSADSAFRHRWEEGINKRWRMQSHTSYAKRGKR